MKMYKLLSVFIVIVMFSGMQAFAQNQITGNYYYHNDTTMPMANVNVNLFNINDSLIATDLTNDLGEFNLTGIPNGVYVMTAETSSEAGGVDIFDALMVFWAAHGWIDLNDVEFAASDVDADLEVDMWDFHLIFVEYLVQGNPFPGGDWAFDNVDVSFTSRTIGDSTNIRTWATSRGDVEGEWDPSGRDIDLFNSDYYKLNVNDQQVTTKFAISTDFDGKLNGFDLNLAYPIDKLNIISISGPDDYFNYSVDEKSGVIKANWLNQSLEASTVTGNELFVIEVEGNHGEQIERGELVSLLPGGMLIDDEYNKLKNTEIKLPLVENEQTNVDVIAYPNPVVSKLKFNIKAENAFTHASITLYDLSGRKVADISDVEIHQGEQEISVNTENLIPGNYVYSFSLYGEGEKNIRGHFVKSK